MKKKQSLLRALLIAAVIFGWHIFQPGKSLAVVTDVTLTGLPPNTVITVTNETTKKKEEQKTDETGTIVIPVGGERIWEPGDYTVTVEEPGKTPVTEHFSLHDGSNQVNLTHLNTGTTGQTTTNTPGKSTTTTGETTKTTGQTTTGTTGQTTTGTTGQTTTNTTTGQTNTGTTGQTATSTTGQTTPGTTTATTTGTPTQTATATGQTATGTTSQTAPGTPGQATTGTTGQSVASTGGRAALTEPPKTTFHISDPIRVPIPESPGVSQVATGFAQGLVSGALGSLFGGGPASDGPSLPVRPPYPEQTFTSKDGKTKVNISGAADPDDCQIVVGSVESPGNGAPHLIALANHVGNIMQPTDITVYQIWEEWGGWKIQVSWTKSYFENNRLVRQEHGGWSASWTEFLGRYKSPADIPAIWRDFGGKPFGGIRGVIADFKFPEGQTFNASDWNLVAHITTKDGDFIQTQPFIMDMKSGEKGVLTFTQRETTVWDAAALK